MKITEEDNKTLLNTLLKAMKNALTADKYIQYLPEFQKVKTVPELKSVIANVAHDNADLLFFANYNEEKSRMFAEKELFDILDHIDVGIWVCDANEHYIYANEALVKLSQSISKDAILGFKIRGGSSETFDIQIPDILKETGKPVTAFLDIVSHIKDIHYRQLVTQHPVYDDNGELKYIVAVVERVSQLNERLHEAQTRKIYKMNSDQGPSFEVKNVIAESPQMKEILGLIKQISKIDSAILIEGESGTGKEVLVKEIHKNSKRSNHPLVDINCSAIPESLFESELFGYEKGAFTGAGKEGKIGLIEQANGGTLFLDEINSMPLAIQGKLLRVLETKTIRRIGSTQNIPVDFKLITATNQDLSEMCKEKKFREDLLYRINIIPIKVPPLRQRKDDIAPLVEYYLNQFTTINQKSRLFSSKAMAQFTEYPWPGNVRELKNVVERAVVTLPDETIEIDDVSKFLYMHAVKNDEFNIIHQRGHIKENCNVNLGEKSLSEMVDEYEKQIVEKALNEGRTTYEAAKLLKTSQSTIVKKKQKYGL